VRLHHTGVKHFYHPVVGDVNFSFEAMPLPTDPGLTLTDLSAEPGSPTQDALKLLASWATTLDRDQPSLSPSSPAPQTRNAGQHRHT
jgi:hypothetical protein